MNLATKRRKRFRIWGWLPEITIIEAMILLAIMGIIGGIVQGNSDKQARLDREAAASLAMVKHYEDCVNQVTQNGRLQLTPEAIRECRENAKTFNTK